MVFNNYRPSERDGKGERIMASEKSQPVPIGAVLVDVHGTLVTPRYVGKSELLGQIILKVTGVHIDGRDARRLTNVIRRKLNASRPEEYLNTEENWIEINTWVLAELGKKIPQKEALAIHTEVIGATYKMRPPRYELFNWLLREKFADLKKIVVASNSNRDSVEQTLRAEKIDRWFKEIYTSERVSVSKPSPRFWRRVLDDLKLPPEQVLMVGNSLLNDGVAAQMGIHTVLILDRFDEIEDKQEKDSQLKEYAATGAAKTGKEVLTYTSQHLQRIREFIEPRFEPIAA